MTMTVMKATLMLEYLPTVLQHRSFIRRWEDVVLNSSACNYEDHPVTRRDESDITAVELAALHHELAVDPLRWFADFAMEKPLHSSDTVYQHFQELLRIWYTSGAYDPVNFGGVAAMEELAIIDPDNVSWADSRFYTGSRRAGDVLVPSLRRHVARQINQFRETEPAQRRFRRRV